MQVGLTGLYTILMFLAGKMSNAYWREPVQVDEHGKYAMSLEQLGEIPLEIFVAGTRGGGGTGMYWRKGAHLPEATLFNTCRTCPVARLASASIRLLFSIGIVACDMVVSCMAASNSSRSSQAMCASSHHPTLA